VSAIPPILRFLGPVDPAEGPLGLLGLTPETCDAASVRAALASQLNRVSRHPEGSGPEADEVRLALHVAAAQLLDPLVRDEVLQEWREYRGEAGSFSLVRDGPRSATIDLSAAPSRQNVAGPSRAGAAGRAAFQRLALTAIVHSGGWNKEAQRRIASLAAAYDMGVAETREALIDFARRHARRSPEGAAVRRAIAPEPSEPSETPARRARRWGSLAALVVMAVAIVFLVRELAQRWPDAVRFIRETASARETAGPGSSSHAGEGAGSGGWSETAPRVSEPELLVEPRAGEQPRVIGRVVDRWADVARRLVDQPVGATPESRLERAVRMAWMNSAAAANWDGRTTDGDRMVAASQRTIVAEPQDTGAAGRSIDLTRLTGAAVGPDGILAARLALARRVTPTPEAVATMLTTMRSAKELGPADADMVVETALLSAHNDLRRAARRLVLDESGNPAVVYALLESLTKAPRQPTVGALVASVCAEGLPPVDDPRWGAAARRALVTRLSELVGGAAHPRADLLSAGMADALRGRQPEHAPVSGTNVSPGSSEADAGEAMRESTDEAYQASRERCSALLTEADRTRSGRLVAARLHAIKERREARLELAAGPLQRFHAEQLTAAEALALIAGVERPAAAARANAIIDDLASARRTASDITAQIEATEAAIIRLWGVRLGVPARASGGGGR